MTVLRRSNSSSSSSINIYSCGRVVVVVVVGREVEVVEIVVMEVV